MNPLIELVDAAFSTLFNEYGFVRKSEVDAHVEYVRAPLSIGFWWGKGEIEILFEIDIAFTKEHKIFRPYISRIFSLGQLALRNDAAALKPFRDLYKSWPGPVAPITSSERASQFLNVAAEVMRMHCRHILDGDLTLLEKITLERKHS